LRRVLLLSGLSTKVINIFLGRSISYIERMELSIHSVFDSLLLYYPEWFEARDFESQKFWKHIVRKLICISIDNIDLVCKYYKEFGNLVWVRATDTQVNKPPEFSRSNPFKKLYWKYHNYFVLHDKDDAARLAHLISTRHFPSGSDRTGEKSLEKFQNLVSQIPDISISALLEAKNAAYKVGKKIINLRDFRVPDVTEIGHISVNTAGDYDITCAEGGRMTKVVSEVREVLEYVPNKTQLMEIPLGFSVLDQEGIPRWQSWCRHEPPIFIGPFAEPFSRSFGRYTYWNDDRRYGLDEALGPQIYAIALLKAQEFGFIDDRNKPIPCRVISVSEPGAKSRIVTTSVWWNIILQQPLGHLLRAYLEQHPSAKDGLIRSDQAWNFCNRVDSIELPENIDDFGVLSSDLETATDAIDKRLARFLLEGLCDSLGILNIKSKLAIDLVCSNRLVKAVRKSGTSEFLMVRGVLMGEPITKAILTLLNLAAEEEAIRYHLNKPLGPITVKWRCFSVGGDDHIALGPIPYLNRITFNHLRWGSILSESKHGWVRLKVGVVRYCERILYFKEDEFYRVHQRLRVGTRDHNNNYDQSIYVDSMKVRLLSPASKSIDLVDDRNILIGKAKQFGKSLKWLVNGLGMDFAHIVRSRFLFKFYRFLPKVSSKGSNRVFYSLFLPIQLGGLDLYLPGELDKYVRLSIRPLQEMALKVLHEVRGEGPGLSPAERNSLRGIFSNSVKRGFSFEHEFLNYVEEYGFEGLEDIVALPSLAPEALLGVRDKLRLSTKIPYKLLLRELNKRNYCTFDQVLDLAVRGSLFSSMFAKAGKIDRFNTVPWRKRYQQFWEKHPPSEDLDISMVCFSDIELAEYLWGEMGLEVYNIDTSMTEVDADGEYQVNFRKEMLRGLPTLKVNFLGTDLTFYRS